jgi:predicted transcriptional regulator
LIPLSQGYSTAQIAKELGISPSSVPYLVGYFKTELEQLPRID